MILTKAIITEIPSMGDNLYKVNIPLMSDNTGKDMIFDALVCSDPCNYQGYEVGDCVWVDFEDNKYNIAVILGKLYINDIKDSTTFGKYSDLVVTNSVELPADTKIGDYSSKDIFTLYQMVNSMNPSGNYVKYEKNNTYANNIVCMTGEEWDALTTKDPNTLYFLSSAPSES